MNIGIIGAGHVAATLGLGLAQAGHQVLLGCRSPWQPKYEAWIQAAGSMGSVASFREAARFGDLLLMALPWSAIDEVLDALDGADLKGKIVIDTSNAVSFDKGPRLLLDGSSAGEWLQRRLPESRIVKTLNTVSSTVMVKPNFREGTPAMFVSGNDPEAKRTVRSLLEELGWQNVIDLGCIRQSRLQEAMMLACVIGERQLGISGAAFSLLQG